MSDLVPQLVEMFNENAKCADYRHALKNNFISNMAKYK